MNWKRLLREYFSYNDYEKKNLIGLTILLILIICIRLIVANLPVSFHRSHQDNDWLEKANAVFSIPPSEVHTAATTVEFLEPDSFVNLNHVDINELESLGLTKTLAQRFITFRNLQNGFDTSGQVYQVYGIDSVWCDNLLSCALPIIAKLKTDKQRSFDYVEDKEVGYELPPKINLNTADSLTLLSLKGLGPFFVKEIIKLRENLGGIRDYSQLLEIYKMSDETISLIADQTFISASDFEYININTVDVNRLGRHPYLTWKQAKIIVNYRFQHGPYTSLEDLKRINAINDSVYFNIRPYLVLE